MVEFIKFEETNKNIKLFKFGKYSFSTIEVKHLGIALILITIAMMVLRRGEVLNIGIFNFILIYFLTIGLGFLLHELGHKFVAQHYGFISEFRGDFMMMGLAIVMAFTGFLFLAPGAVMILGRPTIKQNGIISIAGPMVNLTLALIFLVLGLIFGWSGIAGYIFSLGIWINSMLGVFNMLPLWVLDGRKVLAWNKLAYFSLMLVLIFLLFASFTNLFIF